ncbi:MAG: biotin/lipoyl-binding protein, partial [Candidatus Latescibacteria bacterium]|nr:biotin/lipoyl-binding protein [bacterium]MBD3424667.1 biotin/lipoyl-binding protein [Candidatus Latescibacterota bacterium]
MPRKICPCLTDLYRSFLQHKPFQLRSKKNNSKRRVSMKRWFLTALISVSVFLFIFAGCGGGNNKQGGDKKKSSIPVEISLVSSGDISTYFTGTATIEAEEETEVVAKVHGVVEELKVEEGDFVRKGDILARLDDEQFRV